MKFRDLIQKRRSIKKFLLNKKVDWRKIIRAIDAARFIPAAGNQFNLRYILVSNKDIIRQFADAAQQDFIANADYAVVCVSDESELEKLYGERGKRFTAQQAGASIENFLLALTDEGLATTWVGYFYEDMIKYLLQIPDEMTIEAIFPIGIEAKNNIMKKPFKKELGNILYYDKWNNKYMQTDSRVRTEWL